MGGGRRSPRADRAQRSLTRHVQPRRQGLPARHLAARGSVAHALTALDAVITLGSPEPASRFIDLTGAVADMPRAEIARLLDGPAGRALLAWRQHPRRAVTFTVGSRATTHLRHEHKYSHYGVEPARRFYFRTEPDTPTGAVAANLAELEAELARCDGAPSRHEAPAQWSNRCAWRSSPRSRTGTPAEPRPPQPWPATATRSPHRPVAELTDNHNGARGVMHAMLADRAEQGLDEPAMSAAADYQQVSSCRHIQQYPGRVALHHLRDYRDRLCRAGHFGDGVGENLGGVLLEIEAGRRGYWIPVGGRELPCDDRFQRPRR
jgi:hypothetical protein